MTISPGTNFDDPRFCGDERTPAQRMHDGDYYVADDELAASTKRAVRLLSLYEQAHPTDPDIAAFLLAQVLGQVGEDVEIRPPLRVDYGHNITIGNGSWANYGLTVLDVAPVVIGADVLIGPNVWLGGSVVVCPGVTIGENSIIGAGAVVTRDIPANCIAVGNPARVVKDLDSTTPRAIEAAGVGVITRTGDHV